MNSNYFMGMNDKKINTERNCEGKKRSALFNDKLVLVLWDRGNHGIVKVGKVFQSSSSPTFD